MYILDLGLIGLERIMGFGCFLFYQYYAKGGSWRLPDGAYETMVLLKDAGGSLYSASFFFGYNFTLRLSLLSITYLFHFNF